MPNALIHEISPYLRQHADNPVEWLPWSDGALARAAREDKLVFLSVGYSTCHWCHVMEHESFENPAVAAVMNRHFINIKVDREERPDLDAAYMAYVQATTGQGGWPMSVWLTPQGRPVFGGTYFPPEDRHGRAGFTRVCEELARLWRDDRTRLGDGAERMLEHLRGDGGRRSTADGDLAGPEVFTAFLRQCQSLFDGEHGGFGGAPKFPRPSVPRLLMRLVERWGIDSPDGQSAWRMSEATLRAMAAGGIHDHLGGGFHRYAVDRWWHVPHYEKMLYDQAQIAEACLDAWQISGDVLFREVAEGVFGYLTGALRDSGGAFHAAEDADSLASPEADHKSEGAFWTWEADEIGRLLAPREAAIFCAAYGVEAAGNARPASDPHGELAGRNTLFRAITDAALAAMFDCDAHEVHRLLEASRAILLGRRAHRPQPHRDDKIVTAWNGLAIGALARGGRVLGRPDLVEAAAVAAAWIRDHLWDGMTLWRSHRGKLGTAAGFPADHAMMIAGLIELHAAQPAGGWLGWALKLQQQLDHRFWDEDASGYVMRPQVGGEVLLTIREDYDGAEPSPNHLAAENLMRLAVLCDQPAFSARAGDLLRAGSATLEDHPFSAPVLLGALDLHQRGVMKFGIPDTAPLASPASEDSRVAALQRAFLPRAVFAPTEGTEILWCENQSCRVWDMA